MAKKTGRKKKPARARAEALPMIFPPWKKGPPRKRKSKLPRRKKRHAPAGTSRPTRLSGPQLVTIDQVTFERGSRKVILVGGGHFASYTYGSSQEAAAAASAALLPDAQWEPSLDLIQADVSTAVPVPSVVHPSPALAGFIIASNTVAWTGPTPSAVSRDMGSPPEAWELARFLTLADHALPRLELEELPPGKVRMRFDLR